MTTPQEARAAAHCLQVRGYEYEARLLTEYADLLERQAAMQAEIENLQAGIRELVCASGAPIMGERQAQPVAWMTHHDEPMLFPSEAEARAYCDDDETPVPLCAAPPALQPLTDEEITATVTRLFPRWREDIQERFVVEVARTIERRVRGKA